MNGIRPFQIVVLGIFAFLAIIAVALVSTYRDSSSGNVNNYGARVVVWGTLDQSAFEQTFRAIRETDRNFNVVEYHFKDINTFDTELVNAMAEGRSPDLVLLPSDRLVKHRAKLVVIPYDTLSLRWFRDNFIEAGEIFARTDGVYALPLAVDPLVMYWNRDILSNAGFSGAPRTWESIVSSVVPLVTTRASDRSITRSAIAFGEYRNVQHARPTLLALALQSGSQMVTETESRYVVGLNESERGSRPPFEAAVQFFTDFSNPVSPLYSWNRAMAMDANAFAAGDLALYFGFGSEARVVGARNPNLNFDMEVVPQGASASVRRTYADVYGFAIPITAQNASGAYTAATVLTNTMYGPTLARSVGMASARRDGVNTDSSPFQIIIDESALIARSWLDPDPNDSALIFQELIESVVSSRERLSNAVVDAVRRLTLEY